jgi:hypothetical protein
MKLSMQSVRTFFCVRKNKSRQPGFMNDIFSDGRRHFVIPRTTGSPRRSLLRLYGTGALMLVTVTSLLGGQANVSRADTSVFYPSRCLGGWQNPEYAEGAITIPIGESPLRINRENAAVLDNASAEIICDSFSGEVPPHPAPSEVVLRFSWRLDTPVAEDVDAPSSAAPSAAPSLVEEQKEEAPKEEPSEDSTIISGEDFVEHVQEILDAPADKPVIFETTEPSHEEEVAPPATESTEESVPVPSTTETPVSEPEAVQPAPVEAAPTVEAAPQAPEPAPLAPAPEPVPAPPAPAAESAPAESAWYRHIIPVARAADLAAVQGSFDSFIDVFYSTSEGVWHRAVSVGSATWQDFRTRIPLTSWHDLANLRISLRVSPSLASHPAIYLDGMSAEIEEVDRNTQLSLFDLFRDRLVNQKQQNEKQIAIVQKEDGQRELWFTPVLWSRIISSESIGAETPIEVVGDNIFWFDAQKLSLWRFNSGSGAYESVSMNQGEASLTLSFTDQAGERHEAVYTVSDNTIRFIGTEEIAARAVREAVVEEAP